uniref:Glycolipid transfer protein domain-containing protein n=1 Tax=Helicotheca tamesis TaxID=374047 RepID=A0A6U0GEQ3_9STRA|eukprot:CAMPEP_0185735894 /NCGR_PEP_ID=MMETSP1171-20130828/26360_1 /TAXON_ID=374046 /ORGANISM="Helicotheca tamensis, Strain CCMP826" /LENGTH=698 /DNA_ID=CAMNT_0028406339 /DNA_START=66 /DNA_END=2162 /DNA_ORIENTATION=-
MILLWALVVIVSLDVSRSAAAADATTSTNAVGRGGGLNGVNLSSISSSIVSSGKNLSSPEFNNSGSFFSPFMASASTSSSSSVSSSSMAQRKSQTSSFISSIPTPRGGGGNASLKLKKQKKKKKQPHKPVIGGEECFLPISSIASLTLSDVATAFRFAIESNRPCRTKPGHKKVLECEKTERTMTMMRAMEEAARKSRGEGVLPAATFPLDDESLFSSSTFNHDQQHNDRKRKNNKSFYNLLTSSGGFGDIDALQFCAAMRIFAEWRLVRQVPDGYRSYAVGMELGHKDVVQNVGKIEEAVHEWIQLRREEDEEAAEEEGGKKKKKDIVVRGPTLRQLLHHEVAQQTHGSTLPKLIDKSAAMGLLWSRRQLQYQTSIFSNVMGIPHVFKDAKHAVSEAYAEIYGHLHGWAIQKIFQMSFRSAPDAGLIFRHMNPEELERVKYKVKRGEIEHSSFEEELDDDDDVVEEEEGEEGNDEQERMEKVEKKKRAKGKANNVEVTEIQQNGKKMKILRSLDNRGIVRKIFRRKKSPKENNAIIAQPSSLRHKFSVPFTRVIRIHVPSKETIRVVSKKKRIVGGLRRVFPYSSSKSASVSPKMEQSNRVRGGAKKSQHEEEGGLKEETKSSKRQEKEDKGKRRKKQKKKKKQINLSHDALEEYVTKQMELDARERIKVYLHVAKPLLNDLEGLFHEMNMEDPSTV